MWEYVEKAIKSFLNDKGVEHGSIDIQEDEINFEWIDGNVSYKTIDEFEHEFQYTISTFELDAGNLVNAKFCRN